MTKTLSSAEVASLLREIAQRSAVAGGNPYRSRAYQRAAEAVGTLSVPLGNLVSAHRLQSVPGIGATIAEIVERLHLLGTHPVLEKLRQEVPAGVVELLAVPGLRPDKAAKLHRELGVSNIEELETAAREQRIRGVKGLGPALERKILEGLDILRQGQNARHLHRAAAAMEAATSRLSEAGLHLRNIQPAGDFRRGCEVVTNLALVAEAPAPFEGTERTRENDLSVYLTDKRSYGAALLFATGAKPHVDQLTGWARARGWELSPDGLRKGRRLVSKTERDIYRALGLAWIPPELREGQGEIERAAKGQIPALVEERDVRGLLHVHTVASDGTNTIEEMAEAARALGYSYLGLADHSQSAGYAGGLSIAAVEAQHREILQINRCFGKDDFRIFKGIESDILPDGSLDYPDEVLRTFDFVVASIHGQFGLDRETQTERLLRAVANPFTTILGHMTGRQLLRRKGYDVDVERVLAACARHGVAVEINANPWRLDIDWRWHQRGAELGCLFSINPDAHSIAELELTRWGVMQARKGGLSKAQILNCMSLKQFTGHLRSRRAA
jgi:DNA polymerase (family 10)